jgi:origin recognition complex subunit 5
VLEKLEIRHAIIDSKECITGRQLLEQAVASAAEAVDSTAGRCENLAALQVQLSAQLEQKELVLVFDGIDGQREAPPTLIPALVRVAESVRLLPT